MGDPREMIEQDLEITCTGITTAAGYDLPEDFLLISRELAMFDQVNNLYPALILQAEEVQTTFIELGWEVEARLGFRFVVYFRPIPDEVPATTANRYRSAIERAIMMDPGRNGYADWTELDQTPMPLIWKDSVSGPVLEVTAHCTVIYTYDPREAAEIP
jgi:hypothetical protein